MRVRVVLAVALTLVGAAIIVVLSERGERMAGTNSVPARSYVVALPPNESACQEGTYLADDSAGARVLVGTHGRPMPALTITFTDAEERVIARGTSPAGGPQREVTVRFDSVVEGARRGVTACIRNHGAWSLALGGQSVDPSAAAIVGGAPSQGAIGIRYVRAGAETWWSLAPVVAQRFGLGKAWVFGTWTLPLSALALVAIWVAALRLVVRESR